MKKSILTLIALSCFLVAGMLFATPASAWVGLAGTVFDGNNDPWTLGGTVTVYGNDGGGYANCGSSPIAVNGTYSITFDCDTFGSDPAAFTEVYVAVSINSGSGGNPSSQNFQFTQLPEAGNRIQNFNTNSGPTAVTLSGFDATTGFNANYAVAALFLVLGGASVFALRRRSTVQA